jgi:UDP-3-O-[3-hydroxymyristoyl] glucosamine N-acyltransferase
MFFKELLYMKPSGPFTLQTLATLSGGTIQETHLDAPSFLVHGISPLHNAESTHLCMLHKKQYLPALQQSNAGACIIAPAYVDIAPKAMRLLVHQNPYKAYALILQAFYPTPQQTPYISEKAHIASSATLGEGCTVEPGAYIGEHVIIGKNSTVGVNSYIGDGVIMGDTCYIENNVSISHTTIGNQVHIFPGARIGQDGFGFASDEAGHYKIPHLGRVTIGNNVTIGANTCIDRGSLTDTVISDWCRLDNLIQIGHNVQIGKGSIIVAQAGIAGSTTIGQFVTIAGQAGVAGHLNIGNNAAILGQSGVIQNVESNMIVSGTPARKIPKKE